MAKDEMREEVRGERDKLLKQMSTSGQIIGVFNSPEGMRGFNIGGATVSNTFHAMVCLEDLYNQMEEVLIKTIGQKNYDRAMKEIRKEFDKHVETLANEVSVVEGEA